jgi:hypothetical protein
MKNGQIKAYLAHLGTRMWTKAPKSLEFEYPVWEKLTGKIAASGFNVLVIDLGEGIRYKSHPELAVPGSFSPEKMREELKRIRGLGLEPIPKLNFSTTHDLWLGEYERMVSTREYYRVCTDLINEVCDLFDGPRFFHLGFDEEGARHQEVKGYDMMVLRQGELWWHDFLLMVDAVEKRGSKAWIWSDKYWTEPHEFLKRMPKSVLQSVWYYDESFDIAELKTHEKQELAKERRRLVNWKRVQSFIDLDKAGFDQVPCGSNWACDENFGNLVKFCRANLTPSHLKGFLMAPWDFTVSGELESLESAVRLTKAALG